MALSLSLLYENTNTTYFEMFLKCVVIFCIAFSHVEAKFNLGLIDTAKNPFQYLEEHKYPYENHTVVTEDGYRLLLVRIPNNKNESSPSSTKPPVLLVHGILATFYDYLVAGPNISFGLKALEYGYDVWLLNTRGSTWSKNHTALDPHSRKFWKFSWHEIGIYDLPATIDYIIDITEYSNISYVGYSQGSTSFLAMASTRPEYNKKISVATLLAPVAFLGHSKFLPIVLLKGATNTVERIVGILGIRELFPYTPLLSRIGQLICNPRSILLAACKLLFYQSIGFSTQINDTIIAAYLTNYPAGVSTMQLLHFLQNAESNEFRLYNYGKEDNIKKYGQTKPPKYNLSAISTPVALYYGANDFLVTIPDEGRLAKALPNVMDNVMVPYNKTNHFDVVIGERAKDLFTEPALSILNQYN